MGLFKNTHEYQEISVHSLEDIKTIIEDYNSFYRLPRCGRGDKNDDETYLQAFFRGQSNSIWGIEPSIVRSNKKEFEILKDFNINEYTTLFDLIAYIQHYNTGTRFIDFTTDLDVALYFACSENFDADAALFLWSYSPHRAEWYTACIQTEVVGINIEEITVQDFSEHIIKKYPWVLDKMTNKDFAISDLNAAIVSFLDHGFMVIPTETSKKNNLRIQRQKGCFVICGVEFEPSFYLSPNKRFSSYAGGNIFYPNSVVVPELLRCGSSVVKIVISKELKQEINKYLKNKGITKKYLFP